jgi:hypothetical protein
MSQVHTLVSFDIDGTLEMGDPPGPLSAGFVRWARDRGCLIGSCSDRTIREQSGMWVDAGIKPDFVVLKHRLDSIRERFPCARFVHIGDTHVDAHYAQQAGFEFIYVLDLARRLDPGGRGLSAPSGGAPGNRNGSGKPDTRTVQP